MRKVLLTLTLLVFSGSISNAADLSFQNVSKIKEGMDPFEVKQIMGKPVSVLKSFIRIGGFTYVFRDDRYDIDFSPRELWVVFDQLPSGNYVAYSLFLKGKRRRGRHREYIELMDWYKWGYEPNPKLKRLRRFRKE